MKTVAQLLKLKAQQNQEVHTIAPHQMVLEALMVMAAKKRRRVTGAERWRGRRHHQRA